MAGVKTYAIMPSREATKQDLAAIERTREMLLSDAPFTSITSVLVWLCEDAMRHERETLTALGWEDS